MVLYCYKGCGRMLCTCEQVLHTCLISWDIKLVLSTRAMHLEEDNFAIQYIIANQNSGMLYSCWCHLNKLWWNNHDSVDYTLHMCCRAVVI